MIAPPPPTLHDAHVATYFVYQNAAKADNGKIAFKGCPLKRRSRVCHVKITGDAPQNLRITVWKTPIGDYMLAARDWNGQ